jgi:hypothetical protein
VIYGLIDYSPHTCIGFKPAKRRLRQALLSIADNYRSIEYWTNLTIPKLSEWLDDIRDLQKKQEEECRNKENSKRQSRSAGM